MNITLAKKILGINSNNKKEIKKRFRILAKKYHPDHGGNIKKFNKIKEAYDLLINFNLDEDNINSINNITFNDIWDSWIGDKTNESRQKITIHLKKLETDNNEI